MAHADGSTKASPNDRHLAAGTHAIRLLWLTASMAGLMAGCTQDYTVVRISNNGIAEFQKAQEVYVKSRGIDERGLAHESSMRDVVRLLRAAIDNDPNCVLFHSRLAEVLLELEPGGDNYSVANQEYNEALRLCCDWVPAHIGLSARATRLSHRYAGNYEEAEDHLEDAEESLEHLMERMKAQRRAMQEVSPEGGFGLAGSSSSEGPELDEKDQLSLLAGWLINNEFWQGENPLGTTGQPGAPSPAGALVEFVERRLRARIEYQRAEIMIVAGKPADVVIEQLNLALQWDPNFNTARLELAAQVRKGGNLEAQESLLHPFMQAAAPAYIRNNGRICYEVASLYAEMYRVHRSDEAFNAASKQLSRLVDEINPAHSAGLLIYANLLYQAGAANRLRAFLVDAQECLDRAEMIDPGLPGAGLLRENIQRALTETRRVKS